MVIMSKEEIEERIDKAIEEVISLFSFRRWLEAQYEDRSWEPEDYARSFKDMIALREVYFDLRDEKAAVETQYKWKYKDALFILERILSRLEYLKK